MIMTGKTQELGEITVPVPLFPLNISVTQARTGASAAIRQSTMKLLAAVSQKAVIFTLVVMRN
jgi:hypothetical protein